MSKSKTRKAFEEVAAPDDKRSFKHAIFLYEAAKLDEELRVCADIVRLFGALPEAATTRLILCGSVDEAAGKIDSFKHKTCGSSFSLAVINLNLFESLSELEFLMRKDVLGDPRSIFLGTLRHMSGRVYTEAKEKIGREDELRFGAPSCLDSYTAAGRAEIPPRIARLAKAYLQDADERSRVGREGSVMMQRTSPALDELYKIPTAFYGTRLTRKWRSADIPMSRGRNARPEIYATLECLQGCALWITRLFVLLGVDREEVRLEAFAPAFRDIFTEGLEQFIALGRRKLGPFFHHAFDLSGRGARSDAAAGF